MTVDEVDEVTTAERPHDNGQVTKIGRTLKSSRAARSQTGMTYSRTRATATKRETTTARKEADGQSAKG